MNDDAGQKKNPQKEKLEALRKRLYSRTDAPEGYSSVGLSPEEKNVPNEWDHTDLADTEHRRKPKEKGSFLNKLLLLSLVLFAGAVVFAFVSLNIGFHSISPEKIHISVSGPVSIPAGDPVSLQVKIQNDNDVALENAVLYVEFPEGTRAPTDSTQEFRRSRISLGTVPAGGESNQVIRAIFFGEQGSVETLEMTVEYGVEKSDTTFQTDRTYDIKIGSTPLSVKITAPAEVNSGQDVEFTADISSNSTETLHNVIMEVDYPFGFTFDEATTEPSRSNNVWNLGDLAPAGKRSITIRGTIEGQTDEERVFRFTTGIATEEDEESVATPFLVYEKTLTLRRPFIGLDLTLGGKKLSEGAVIQSGGLITGAVKWRNNTTSKIADATLHIGLEGDIIDPRSVSIGGGFYDSSTNTLIWSERTDDDLQLLDAGATGDLSFSLGQKRLEETAGKIVNPIIRLNLLMEGRMLGDTSGAIQVKTKATQEVRVAGNLLLSVYGVYHIGPFENTGPLPPRANQETTYTIVLALKTSYNEVADATVIAQLPEYVSWAGQVSPDNADISYNSTTGQVVWHAGTIPAGAGWNGKSDREVAFQVVLKPSVSQLHRAPNLVIEPHAEGEDTFANVTISGTADDVTTNLTGTDPGFDPRASEVTE